MCAGNWDWGPPPVPGGLSHDPLHVSLAHPAQEWETCSCWSKSILTYVPSRQGACHRPSQWSSKWCITKPPVQNLFASLRWMRWLSWSCFRPLLPEELTLNITIPPLNQPLPRVWQQLQSTRKTSLALRVTISILILILSLTRPSHGEKMTRWASLFILLWLKKVVALYLFMAWCGFARAMPWTEALLRQKLRRLRSGACSHNGLAYDALHWQILPIKKHNYMLVKWTNSANKNAVEWSCGSGMYKLVIILT